MTFSYDEDDDVLYVTFSEAKGKTRYAENSNGDIIRYCVETNEIVGLTVLFLALRASRGETIEVPEVGVVTFSPIMASLVARGSGTGKGTH